MRNLKNDEHDLIAFMLKDIPVYKDLIYKLPNNIVKEMDDGGMGSLRFLYNDGKTRRFHKEVANISIMDTDGVPVSFAINVDEYGDLFELDAFKGDFSQLKRFPVSPYYILPTPPQI